MKRSQIKRGTSQLKRTRMAPGSKRLRAKPDLELAEWGRDVMERDAGICGRCHEPGATDPHHIAPRGRRPDLIYVRANGIAVHRECHNWIHDNPIEAVRLGLLSDRTMEIARKENTLGIR